YCSSAVRIVVQARSVQYRDFSASAPPIHTFTFATPAIPCNASSNGPSLTLRQYTPFS
ncbi:hypothetical protein BC826DRAFT_1026233, partial [Russula brevipes]